MEVKNIIKKVASIVDVNLYESIENESLNELQQKEIKHLVNCVNLTISNIASNYFKLYNIVEVVNDNGIIPYSKISNNAIFDIVGVKNSTGKQSFVLKQNGLSTVKGKLTIRYTYFPEDVDYDDVVNYFPVKVSERVIVYGVLSEYLFIKGLFDEALVWEERFKTEMKSINRLQKCVNIRKRSWY